MSKWTPAPGFWERRGIPEPFVELKFHPTRKWRFDFAWRTEKYKEGAIAVEIEGGIWNYGGHVRGSGFLRDAEKYNEATRLGWRIYRFTPQQMETKETAEFLKSVLT